MILSPVLRELQANEDQVLNSIKQIFKICLLSSQLLRAYVCVTT